MHFISNLATLSLIALGVSATPIDKRTTPYRHHNDHIQKLYARAEIIGEAHGIHGHIEFTGRLDGKGTFVKIWVLEGLTKDPSIGPEYSYHIHTNPIGDDGDCAKALGHLDPLQLTDSLLCNPDYPEYCQEGDLSGKHGKLKGTDDGSVSSHGYNDDYVRFFPEDLSILGRSVVIHAANKTRIACGNIISTIDGTADWSLHPTDQPSNYVKNYPTTAYPNPPQVVTYDPSVKDYPFALGNPAISIKESLNVELSVQPAKRTINGTEQTVDLPIETKVS
ncbi:hypothetical protein FRC03_003431 [Tulasnella sp. 419]|nr:hypothetical protein FRC02_009910 [Tulasnella sp. 418]KAG8969330.1 hypothetical protein FRC03_003431 [Tulasnella sp. 419]